ncbi:urease accessory protein UreE [Microbulbifer agarilyticus]|uniref:urease accessory protein UreE n=1 Tax=Microbulbifer agarilyticus TaxID=260552 RepID=UPI001C93DA2C|nr:urease accessory protein UreE [Microbulbifer agarilyticus]MBY6190234.1 urease accessory protein UreE [Microbulbifer agarilyticus]
MKLDVYQRLGSRADVAATEQVVLDHLQRDRGRLRATTLGGHEIRIFLERGKPLLVGEILQSECGKSIQVVGADEPVTTAYAADWQTFSRACYHLGNRHVKLQIANADGERWLRFTPDHVLEEMLGLLGLTLKKERAVFVPESGAYSGGHGHGHASSHSHSHEHSHEHSQSHSNNAGAAHEHHHH